MTCRTLACVVTLTVAWWTATGCSGDMSSKGASDTAYDEDAASSPTSDVSFDTGGSATAAPEARWFSLDGQLAVRDGNVSLEASLFTLGFWGESNLAPSLYCSVASSVTATTAVSPTPDPALLGWWEVVLTDDGSCPSSPGPLSLSLGIGPYDALLDPAMDQEGLEAGSWNGAYLALNDQDTVWVFGILGTADQATGVAPALRRSPVPDGDYLLTTLHLLPL